LILPEQTAQASSPLFHFGDDTEDCLQQGNLVLLDQYALALV
jgi:hypothetical protein